MSQANRVDQALKTEFCNYVASFYASDYYTTEAGKIELADDIQFYENLVAQYEAEGNQKQADDFKLSIKRCGRVLYPLFADGIALTTAQVFEHFDTFHKARYIDLRYEFGADSIDREAFRGYFERKLGFEEQPRT